MSAVEFDRLRVEFVQRFAVHVGHRYVCDRRLCDWPLREFSPEAIQEALPLVRPDGKLDAIHASAKIIDKVFRDVVERHFFGSFPM
jgi:hypothetical protein